MSKNEESQKALLVVADTNLFFECQKLEDLPWQELGHDPITIVVAKPVLEEIDKHKKATGRTRGRALEIFGRFRKARQDKQSEIVIRDANPRVTLERRAATKPDKNLNGQLDFHLNDERLLGIVSTLAIENPDKSVVFLSHDEGPIGLAEELDLGAHQIEDHWLRPTRQSDEQKKIDALKSELAKFQDNEPKFIITVEGDRNDKGKLPFFRYSTIPLEAEETQTLIERLRQKHPMKTDFSPPAPEVENDHSRWMRVERTFSSPTDEDIEKYQKTEYPRWISRCTSILERLHETNAHPNKPFLMRFIATNVGSRPANKVRVDFKAKGGVLLRRIRHDDDASETEKPSTKCVTKLPPAPKPPAFQVSVVTAELENPSELAQLGRKMDRVGTDLSKLMEGMYNPTLQSSLKNLLGHHRNIATMGAIPPSIITQPIINPRDLRIPKHDPEGFYYSDWEPFVATATGSLTCDLWRHSSDPETFEFEIFFPTNSNGNAAIECSIHAENLTKPVSLIVPVVMEEIEARVAVDALSLVDSST